MSKQIALPNSAPFAPDQIAALDQVFGNASPLQRAWLSGFLAGIDAAESKAPAVAAPVQKRPLLLLYATESGNSEALASKTKADAQKRGFAVRSADMADVDIATLKNAGNIVAIVSTWGDGEPPQRAAPFFRALMSEDAPRLDGVNFAVLALGDSSYPLFCESGKQVDERFAALGATRVAPRIDLDLDYEAGAKTWLAEVLETLNPPVPGSVIHVDFHKTLPLPAKATNFDAAVSALHKLTSERSTSHTYHLELSLEGSGLTYEPGDALGIQPQNDPELVSAVRNAAGLGDDLNLTTALTCRFDINTLSLKLLKDYAAASGNAEAQALAGDEAKARAFIDGRQLIDLLETFPAKLGTEQLTGLLRPLAPRLYSIASSQKLVGEEAHLTIAEVAYESAGRARFGVTSSMIAQRLHEGDTANVFIKPNTHFRLPTDPATPIVMIGAGTGLAPYRGFLQELEATNTGTDSWLIFGHRKFLHDFLYQLEIQNWLKEGVLGRLDLATSRDQPEKRYVQHALWEQRTQLQDKLEAGATIYLCGDAKHMARDVDATLIRILGADEATGRKALDGLISAGRYKKDVY